MRSYNANYNENREYENLVNEIRIEHNVTFRELGERCGCSTSFWWAVSQGYWGPLYAKGKFIGSPKPWATKFCKEFNVELGDVWPREVCSLNKSVLPDDIAAEFLIGEYSKKMAEGYPISADAINIRYLLSISDLVDTSAEKIDRIIILRRMYGDTLEELANQLNVTRERIRQRETRQLRRIRSFLHKTNWIHNY